MRGNYSNLTPNNKNTKPFDVSSISYLFCYIFYNDTYIISTIIKRLMIKIYSNVLNCNKIVMKVKFPVLVFLIYIPCLHAPALSLMLCVCYIAQLLDALYIGG